MAGGVDTREDLDIIAAVKAGDVRSFADLVERHQRALMNYFYRLCWDRQVAEDCAQEVFLRLYRHLGSYRPEAKFTTFLYRIARNLWIDRARTSAVNGRPASLDSGAEGRTMGDRLQAVAPGPVEILTRQETSLALQRAIDRLPDEQKSVLVLGEVEGMKYEDIGAILDIPVGTVKSRMHTAMSKLRDLFQEPEA